MKQSIFDKIRSYLAGQIIRFSIRFFNHNFGCCNKITKNCNKCKYPIKDDMYKNDGYIEKEKNHGSKANN